MPNPNFNIYEFLKTRPLSYSALNCFADPQWGSPEKWYKSYILGERQESKELTFGSYVDKKIQDDPNFIPSLPRYPEMQYKMRAVFNNIPLVGVPDGLDLEKFLLADYKTGKIAWDYKKAHETKQLTFYLFLLYILDKKYTPEKFKLFIHWLPTKENGDFSISLVNENLVKTFETKRTMADLLKIGQFINKTVLEMQEYVRNHN